MKRDCFAFFEANKRPGCTALQSLECASGECSFYKTKYQCMKERVFARERWAKLGLLELIEKDNERHRTKRSYEHHD